MSARTTALSELVRGGAFDWHRPAGWRSLLRTTRLLARPAKLASLLELELVKELARTRGPEAFSFLTTARFLARQLSLEQRVDCAHHHFSYEQATYSRAYIDAVYRGQGLELWRVESEGHVFAIRLMVANDNLWEGYLSVVAFVDDQRVCVFSFSYVDAAIFAEPSAPIVFVTRKQSGRHPAEQQAFARAFHHSSPPYFCLAALAGIALANGTRALAAIRHDAHAAYSRSDAQVLRKSYDEFWAVFHATELDEKAYRIAVPFELGDLAEVSANHRRRAKLRRERWSEVTESACATLRSFATSEPAERS